MKRINSLLIAVLITLLGITVVSARHHSEPSGMRAWVARDGLMHLISDQRGILEDMAEGTIPTDRGEFVRAAYALSALFRLIPSAFTSNSNPPMSRSRPEIWENWDDFTATAMENANIASDIADTAVLDGIEAAKAKVGNIDCDSCHEPYRADN